MIFAAWRVGTPRSPVHLCEWGHHWRGGDGWEPICNNKAGVLRWTQGEPPHVLVSIAGYEYATSGDWENPNPERRPLCRRCAQRLGNRFTWELQTVYAIDALAASGVVARLMAEYAAPR